MEKTPTLWAQEKCPHCGQAVRGYDHAPERRWRHLNVCQLPSEIVYALPREHQRHLRTSNSLECVNRELKRRTRVAGLFPNEASRLRLVSALLADLSEEWETGKFTSTWKTKPSPQFKCPANLQN
jgi:hypothetical protein